MTPSPKRILVTGGAGFISSNMIRHLLAATPHEVVSLDALTYAGNMDNLADVMGHERLTFVHGDIRDPRPGVDAPFHGRATRAHAITPGTRRPAGGTPARGG